jgi:hypothetical protein
MAPIKLTLSQIYFLKILTDYKPFARRENFVLDQTHKQAPKNIGSYESLEAELLALKVLKMDKAGRVSLSKSWEQTRQLMNVQTDTPETVQASIAERLVWLAEYTSTIDRFNASRPAWPSQDYHAWQHAIEQRSYVQSQIADLKQRLNMIGGA